MPQAVAAAAVWVGTAVGSGLTAIGVGSAIAFPIAATALAATYYGTQMLLQAGLMAVIDDLAHQKAKPQGQELRLSLAADVAREMIIGQRPTAGSLVARYSRGSNLYNAHFVYQLADHPCTELSKVYADGRIVQSTALTHGTRTVITAYSYSGGPRVWMTWHDGRPGQTYDSDLVTKSALDPDVVSGAINGWTTAHVGAGCAYVHVEVQWDSDILTAIPNFLFLVKGAPLYDRRLDSTAGGSGSQRLNNPSTWTWTDNAAVATDHYMLGYQVEGDPLAFGIGLSKIEVPYATFAALANLADEDVTTGTGGAVEVMKRYRANGIVSTAETFQDVLESFQIQMCARIVDLGGRIGILGAEARSTVVTLTDDDWADDDVVRFADKLPFSDLYGAVIGSFPDPANMWQPTPYQRQTTSYLQLPDGGEAITAQLDMPMEIHPRRAVRNASAWIARESLQPRLAGAFATRSQAWKLEPGDWFQITSARLQITAEKFEVIDIVKAEDFSVTITARSINPNFLAFSVSNDPSLSVPPAIAPYSYLLNVPTFDVTVSTLTAGAVVEPCLEFTLTSDEVIAREVVVEISKWISPDLIGPTLVDSFHVSQIVTKLRKGILPSTSYKVRAKTRAGVRESPWTSWLGPYTTGSTYSVGGAATVPWSGVTDDASTRPANNATVGARAGTNVFRTDGTTILTQSDIRTVEGTAASITGQGDLATTNRAALPFGANGLFDSDFLRGTTLWARYWGGNTGTAISSGVNLSGWFGARNVLFGTAAGTPANATAFEFGASAPDNSNARMMRVAPGDRVYFRALMAHHRATNAYLDLHFWNASLTYLGSLVANTGSVLNGGADGLPANFGLVEGYGAAPSSAAFCSLKMRVTCNGSGADPYGFACEPMVMRVPASQTASAVPYMPGRPDPLGDQTLANTAAAISGQGTQALANHQRGATYSGTPIEGSWWSDTSASQLKLYTGGAWQIVADIAGSAPAPQSGQATTLLASTVYVDCFTRTISVTAGQKIRVTVMGDLGVGETSTVSRVTFRALAGGVISGNFLTTEAQFDDTTPLIVAAGGSGIFTAASTGSATIKLQAKLTVGTSGGNGKCYDPGGTIITEII